MSRNIETRGGITIVQNKYIANSRVEFQFDAVTLEEHTATLEVTQEPLESGAITTDHAIIAPKQYTLTGIVSAIKTSNGIPRGGVKNSLNLRASYEQLIRLQQSREFFDIITPLFIYENLLIESITTSQDKDSANILIFSADMIQVNISRTQSVPLPREKITPEAQDRGASTDQQGRKAPEEQGEVKDDRDILQKLDAGTSRFFRRAA